MGRQNTGIELREKSIRLNFALEGKLKKVALKMPPTAANIKYATKLMVSVRAAIAKNTFSWEQFFPDSPQARKDRGELPTSDIPEKFCIWCKTFLETKGQLAPNTLEQYTNALEFWKKLLSPDTDISKIRHHELAAKIGKHNWASAKLHNNYLIPLRGVFKIASKALDFTNPMIDIDNTKLQVPHPDPLSIDEQEKVLKSMKTHHDLRAWAYFEFAFMTGMRPEELIELRWGDVDWHERTIKVQRARTSKGVKTIKTYSARDVDMVRRAIAALETMKPWTFVGGTTLSDTRLGRHIFQNPETGKPWHDERSQRDTFWRPTLSRLGIRWRRAYQTRHTFASTALSAGANPTYVAKQMGHVDARMLFQVYAKWIGDGGRERDKREAMLAAHEQSLHTPHQLPNTESQQNAS